MTTDLSRGIDENREFVFAAQPDDPEIRESVNVWMWDEGTSFGMPRIGVEAVGDQWETHDIQVNIALADGRIFNFLGPGKTHQCLGDDGRPRILGAGPLSFELIEPFRHWRCRLSGEAVETSVQAQIEGWMPGTDGPRQPVDLEVEVRSVVPAVEWGTLREEAGRVLATQEEGDLMGGPRYEQLFRAIGHLKVGNEDFELNGGGLRIRRQGIRRMAAFRGHVWQSTVFPSGRAFGLCVYPPRTDRKPTFNEAFVYEGEGGELTPAMVVEAPWLRQLQARDEDVSVVLETERGRTTIGGTTVLSTFMDMGPAGIPFQLQQAIARYTLDGETANGMLERSSAPEQLNPS